MSIFKCEQNGKRHIIQLPSHLDKAAGDAFTAESQAWLLLGVEEHILDFANVTMLEKAFYPAVTAFARLLTKSQKKIHSMHLRSNVERQVSEDGMKNLFSPIADPTKTQAPLKLDVRFINPFLSAIKEVFSTQANTTITPGKPLTSQAAAALDIGIVGILALNSEHFRGTIAICFPSAVFLKVYERMLGEAHTEITSETEDAVAELTNIIYGMAKTELNRDLGMDLQPSLPTVLRGEKLALRQQTGSKAILLPFDSEIGTFHVEIATAPHPAQPQKKAS